MPVGHLPQAANGLATVLARPIDLRDQLGWWPGRPTARVPRGKKREGLGVLQAEASNEAAANLEGVHVAVVAGERRGHGVQVVAGSVDGGVRRNRSTSAAH